MSSTLLAVDLIGSRTGGAAETAVARTISLVEIEIDEGNVFEFDVFPNIDFSPIE